MSALSSALRRAMISSNRSPMNMMRLGRVGLLAATLPLTTGVQAEPAPLAISARALPLVGEVDERFQSYQVGFSHVTGGRTWRSYDKLPAGRRSAGAQDVADDNSGLYEKRLAIDFGNPRLRRLAAALGPAYIRYSGTTANSVYFQDDDASMQAPPPGYKEVLTRAAWKGAVDFAKAVDAKILTSFTITSAVRDQAGLWTSRHAKPWIAYSASIGGDIYAAELFNEPNLSEFGSGPKGYDGSQYARDIAAFRAFRQGAAPALKLAGPGDVVMGGPIPGHPSAEDLMKGQPTPRLDIVSYHYYGAVSERCAPPDAPSGISADKALSEEWLSRPDASFRQHRALRDRYAPGAPIWLTETGGAACGGSPWHSTFLDSFRLMDQQGRLAKQGLSAMFTHALLGENYGLMDEKTFTPRPNYWAMFVWRRFMGAKVLDAGSNRTGLHVYAHCMRGKSGGVALLAINLGAAPVPLRLDDRATAYALTAPTLQSRTVDLNGTRLEVGAGDRLPRLRGVPVRAGAVALAPSSITFLTVPSAANRSCRT